MGIFPDAQGQLTPQSLVHRDSTDYLLLRIASGVVWQSRDLLTFTQHFVSAESWSWHGVQRRMISVDIFFVFLRLLFFALLLLYVTQCMMWKLYFTFLMC